MISTELQLAIYALDSYNRGYGAGLSDPSLTDAAGIQFAGSEIILASDSTPLSDEVSAGFYAAAYSVTSGDLADKTVISFRGTDNIDRFCQCGILHS